MSFGATQALDHVCLQLWPGVVHVVAGANGAGKTTLIRILSGACTGHTGIVRVEGQRVEFRNPADAFRLGIAPIHQELSLVGSLSIADNLLLGAPGSMLAPLRPARLREAVQRTLELVELDVEPDRLIEDLPLAQQQLVEIARALVQHARVFIMDEPTSALREAEVDLLFSQIRRLRDQGAAIVYISHRLEEIYRIGDAITVLRDGRVVASGTADALPRAHLVRAMVDREPGDGVVARPLNQEPTALGVKGLRWGSRRSATGTALSFVLREGEVLGIAGLQGSGSSELLHTVFGSFGAVEANAVQLGGRQHQVRSPRDSIARGVVLLCNDRHESVLGELNVVANVTLSSLPRFSPFGWRLGAREWGAVWAEVARLGLSATSLDVQARQLSGGNQQKVALARCLLAEPRVLLLDEPTRGVDVGAKLEIHSLIHGLRARRVAVMLVSSELEELITLSDRILILHRMSPMAVLGRPDFSRERILRLAMGSEATC